MSKCNIGKFIATSLLGSSLALNGAMPGIVALADEAEPGQVAVDGSQSQTGAPEEGGSPSSAPENAAEAVSEETPDVSDIPADSVETPEATPEQGDADAAGTEGPVAEPDTDAAAGEPAEGGASDEAPAAPAGADAPEAGEDAAVSAEGDVPAAAQTPDEAPAALSAAEALSFVYVEQPSVEASGTQNIAFILSDPAADVVGATLDVLCPDGTVRQFSSSAVSGAAMRFQIDASELGQGYVELSQLTVALADGSSRTVSLSSDGSLDYGFTVSGTYYSLFASEQQAQSDVSFYVASGDGIVEASSIEGALAQAQADTPSTYAASRSASSKIVVALDAGHDSSKHPGAGGNGLREEELTLKIAQYAKAELETYPGVEVYMVRSSGECPYPDAATEGEELQQRVEGAVAAGAHVYVSIHLNSYDSSSVSGAEVWYPNQSVNTTVADVGEELSQDILDQLTDLGLYDRGTKENESLGEGSDLDYYSVIRNSKLNGIPGIIVEHAFISSSADYGYLSTEEGLRALGVADATGIANYFGLTKDGSSEPVSAQGGVLELGRATSSSFQIVARNVVCSRGVEAVSVGISRVGSDEEARWYPLEKQQDGTWRATIPFSDFDGVAGEYALVGALSDSDWAGRVFCETTLEIDPASQPALVEASYDSSTGSLKAVASGGSLSRASNVAFAVAGANGSTVWYQGVRAQDGSWSASVPRSAHGTGACTVQVWATVGSQTSMLASASSSFPEVGAASGKLSVGAYDAASGTFEVAATGVSYGGGVQGVSVGVWYQADGAATQRWYALQRQSDGSWSARIPTSDFGDRSGTYAVQAALSDATWTARSFGGTATGTVTVAAPEVEASYDSSTGSLKAVASGGSLSRASNVAFAVAGANGSTVWYQGVRAQDGSWSASVPRSAHGTGACTVQVWATVGSQTSMLASASSSFPAPEEPIEGTASVALSDDSASFVLTAEGGSFPDAWNVSFAVADLATGSERWVQAYRAADGSWSAEVPVSSCNGNEQRVGAWAAVGDKTVELGSATFSSRLHPIMNDESDVDPATLAEAFADAGGIYPADTYKTKGAATAEEFFTILVEEAEAEGVDQLAVYAQLVYETGYLRFGGDVKAEQCNFCGLGATGAGAGGATFPSVRAGIRAQVQHLKAYASTEDLVNECVDPRFEHVDRGCAPYLESLGGRWAVSSSYGFGLSIIVDSLA